MANKKNGGVVPPLPLGPDGRPDERVLLVPVGCGNCMECRKMKARDWQVRLTEEVKRNELKGIFVTLTFSDEYIEELYYDIIENNKKAEKLNSYDISNYIAKKAVRRFLERWRKKYKKSVRHWLVTELGQNGTENLHLHGIIWTDKDPKEIDRIWKYGYTWLSSDNQGYVNYRTVNYVVKYVHKTDEKHKEYKPIILTSPGIGKGYNKSWNFEQNKYRKEGTDEKYRNEQGYAFGMPIYYRNQRYTEEEREKLWIEKLNEQKRYVDGIEVDVSKGDEQYWKMLKYAREKNARLGYGNDDVNWNRRNYENDISNLNRMKRLERAKKRKGT